MDWSGFEVDLTLGAPDLYPIQTAAEEERRGISAPIGDSGGSIADSCISHRI